MRIAIAGFQHETNTFAPGKTGINEFHIADSWPGLLLGEAVVHETRGMNLPIAGAVTAAAGQAIELIPLLWCAAEPGGPVTDAAFDNISQQIIDGVVTALPLDGIYLDLHGAMVTASHEDGEGVLLKRLRDVVGHAMPIGISLDLHANVSPAMAELATVITLYRTYPHLDMANTGARCLQHLLKTINGARYYKAFRQIPFLIPLHAQYTAQPPCSELYQLIEAVRETNGAYADLALGFTAADVHDCGPSIIACADNAQQANTIADTLLTEMCNAMPRFDTRLLSADEAAQHALSSITPTTTGPVVIADVQDNPGGWWHS